MKFARGRKFISHEDYLVPIIFDAGYEPHGNFWRSVFFKSLFLSVLQN